MPGRVRLVAAAAAIAAAGLAGCHRRADDPAAVTADEQAQLNDAAATLDADAAPANDHAPDGDNGEDPQ